MGIISIDFPNNCSHRFLQYQPMLEQYQLALKSPDSVLIDCRKIKFIRPMGLSLLASIVYDLARDAQRTVFLHKPQNPGVLQYLEDQDFFKEFPISTSQSNVAASQRTSSLGLKRLDFYDASYLESIPFWLRRNSHMPQEAIEDVISISVPEIINNVFDHSQSPIGCYISAQAYPNEKRLLLSAVDLGIGFWATLRTRFPGLKNGADAIEMAVLQGVTSQSKDHNRGAGLDVLCGLLKEYKGSMEIISRDGRWKQHRDGKSEKNTLPFQFPGTCLNLEFDEQALIDRFVTVEI